MLACDRKKILVELRQFSLDFQQEFSFLYKYKDSAGKKQEVEIFVNLEEEGEDGQFPFTAPKYRDETSLNAVEMDFAEYSEVLANKQIKVTLPKSGEEIRFTQLDGNGEAIGAATKKTDRSSHTLLKMRNPVKFVQKSEGKDFVPVQLDLDKLSYKDIEFLRKEIKSWEGNVDTETIFEHPEGDAAPSGEKEVVLDLLSTTAFFFSSGAI